MQYALNPVHEVEAIDTEVWQKNSVPRTLFTPESGFLDRLLHVFRLFRQQSIRPKPMPKPGRHVKADCETAMSAPLSHATEESVQP